MTDFGRKDFGDALKKLLTEKFPEDVEELGADQTLKPTADAKDAYGDGKTNMLGKRKQSIDEAKENWVKFEKLWTPFKEVLSNSNAVVAELVAFQAANKRNRNDAEVTGDEASKELWGGNKKALAARAAAYNKAGDERDTQTRSGKEYTKSFGKPDWSAEVDPETPTWGTHAPKQIPFVTMRGTGGLSKRIPGERTVKGQSLDTAHTLSDFADILAEITQHLELQEVVHKNKKPVAKADAGDPNVVDAPVETNRLNKLIVKLRKFAMDMKEQSDKMDVTVQQAIENIQGKDTSIQEDYLGLAHLSEEQKAHVITLKKKAAEEIGKLKDQLAPLNKRGGVEELIAQVDRMTKELAAKDAKMKKEKQEYEALLDFYERIMLKMKKAHMQTQRELDNVHAAMAGQFDGDFDDELAHYKPQGKKLTESVKKKRKKKVKVDQNYGTFNFNEHLEKARKDLPKASYDW